MAPRCVFRTNWVTMPSIQLLLQVPKRPWSWFWKLVSKFNILVAPIPTMTNPTYSPSCLDRCFDLAQCMGGLLFRNDMFKTYCKYLFSFLTVPFGLETNNRVFISVQYFQMLICKTVKTDRRVNKSNIASMSHGNQTKQSCFHWDWDLWHQRDSSWKN